jgi:hypothetical protein
MAKKTSIHVCAAKYGAEKHNRREKEMKHVHPEYSHLNKTWESPDFKSVADEIRKAKERYSAMHLCRKAKLGKDGKQLTIPAYDKKTGDPIVDPVTGLQKKIPAWEPDPSKPKKMPKNSEPIREGVAVITEATTMEQLHELARSIELHFGIKTKAIYAHLDEGHEHLVTDKDHEKGKYLDIPEGDTIFLWNYHAHYVFDWTDHNTGQCINLNRHNMSELQDMLANTFKMERGKKSDKKWRDSHSYKAEQEAIRAKEAAEYVERKKSESKQIIDAIKENSNKLSKLQKALDDLLSATSVPEESLDAVPFAEMTFTLKGSDKVIPAQDLVDDALRRISEDVNTPIPLLKRDEWQKERNAKAKQIVTILQQQLLSVSKLHKKQINNVGKQMYLDAKQKVALAAKTEEENVRLKQRISELDEKAIAREKAKTADAERKAQEQTARADREEQRADAAESRLSKMEQFIRQAGVSKAFANWNLLNEIVDKAITSFNAWAHGNASIFNRNEERVIGQGIIAQCQLDGLNPCKETDRKTAADSIAEMAEAAVGSITQFKWDLAVRRIGQLASEMTVSMGGQSVGGSNGNADELTNWDGTKKKGLGW